MHASPPARSVLLVAALLAVAACPPVASAGPIDVIFGTYNHVSNLPGSNTSATVGTSMFYLRDAADFRPDSIAGVSTVEVQLLPITDPTTHLFPVTLLDPATGANDLKVKTLLPATTTFNFAAPEALLELLTPTQLLLVSALNLTTATDPIFSDFTSNNGVFLAALEGVTIHPPAGPGTPTVTFDTTASSAPFALIVPEPASLLVWLGAGAGACWLWRRRSRRATPAA